MTIQHSKLIVIVLTLCSLFFNSCEEDNVIDDFLNPVPTFSIDQFEQNIIDAFEGNTTGFSYTIALNGQKVAGGAKGHAIVPGTSSEFPNGTVMTEKTRMHIASVTKPITAIALYKALENSTATLNSPFVNYLPSTWIIDPSYNDITLQQLVEHTSGIVAGGTKYEDQKNMLETVEVLANDKNNYEYNNANYSLFRIIIPYIIESNYLQGIENSDSFLSVELIRIFQEYLQNEVASPADVTVKWQNDRDKPTLLYNFDDPTFSPWNTPDYSEGCGAFGLYLSTFDIAAIMAYAKHSNSYLNASSRESFFDNDIGLKTTSGEHGTYLHHGGDWYTSSPRRGMMGTTMIFTNNVEATILINCREGSHGSDGTELKNAFDNAWN